MDKKRFRTNCLKRLRSSPQAQRYAKDKKISWHIERFLKKRSLKSVLFYLPLDLEVNLRQLLETTRRHAKVFVPFIEGESFKMVEYRLPLEKNSFGILEPKAHNRTHKKVDLIIVPVVGIDRNMQRVGFGKGMYDKFFDTLQKKPIVLFVQRDSCKSTKRICDSYDIRGDYYISSKERIIH